VVPRSWPLVVMALLASTTWTQVGAEAGKAELERPIAEAYVDKGRVQRKGIEVHGEVVDYLEAGPLDARTVVFCHGAAFTMWTFQVVGVLDALAEMDVHSIALNLPGYGASSKSLGADKETYLSEVLKALRIDEPVVVVAASMGGTYAMPFVLAQPARVAGYVSAAGLLPSRLETVEVPTLFVYGDQDPRLENDKATIAAHFAESHTVVFKDAPHPCYLRDLDAANYFTHLVTNFAQGLPGLSDTESESFLLPVHAHWPTAAYQREFEHAQKHKKKHKKKT